MVNLAGMRGESCTVFGEASTRFPPLAAECEVSRINSEMKDPIGSDADPVDWIAAFGQYIRCPSQMCNPLISFHSSIREYPIYYATCVPSCLLFASRICPTLMRSLWARCCSSSLDSADGFFSVAHKTANRHTCITNGQSYNDSFHPLLPPTSICLRRIDATF